MPRILTAEKKFGKLSHYIVPFIAGSLAGAFLALVLTSKRRIENISIAQRANERSEEFADSIEYDLISKISEAINSIERNTLKLIDEEQNLTTEHSERLIETIETTKGFLKISLEKLAKISKKHHPL